MQDNEIKLVAGVTNDDEIYVLRITTVRNGKPYFSMGGETYDPLLMEDAIKRNDEQTTDEELKDFWKEAVTHNQTTESLEDWAESVREEQGEIGSLDCSLYPKEHEIDGEDVVYESVSCGQHVEKKLKHYSIPVTTFKKLMKLWDENHLKDVKVELPTLVYVAAEDLDAEIIKATKVIFANR
jgi:hypothetical protein